ncbi:MAG: peptidyl-prolyl cis-trans isomerase SurA [Arenicella sp.]|jgi:peptidyl-prolyl cis-trans isomerase SurA
MKLFQKHMMKMQSQLFKSTLLLTGLFFLIPSIHCFAQELKPIDKIIAKVGEEYILLSDIQNQKLSLKQNNMAVSSAMDCEIIEGLMYEKLLTNQAVIDSVEVGDEIVHQEMESRLQVIAQQIGSMDRLEEFYGKSVAQIKAEFFEVIKKRMQAERMKEEVTAAVDVTPKEVKEFYNALPKDSIPYINSKITVAQIVMYPKLTDKDKETAKKAIEESKERVTSGARSFQTEAVLNSMDPGSAVQGGDLGWQTKGTMVPEFEAAIFKLEESEISPIFETQYGFHFLQLLDRKGDNYHVRHILISPEVDKTALLTTKKRMDSIYTEINAGTITFEAAALKFSDDLKSNTNGGKIVNPYSGDYKWDLQNINEIDPQMSRFIERLNIEELAPASLYDNYFDQKQGVRIVKLLGKSKPHLANLDDDYQLIQMAALNEKKEEVIDAWVKSKISGNYIWILEAYATKCEFKHEWVKKGI